MTIWLNGLGSHLPTRVMDNRSFLALTGLEAARVPGRIAHRFLAPPGVGTMELAAAAARDAMAQAPELTGRIGLVAVASTFPGAGGHYRAPPAAALTRKLGLAAARAVDLGTPLLGFHDALCVALEALRGDDLQAALVVGAEGFSQTTQLKDRRISHLLSDGAGALLLSRQAGFARLGPVRFGGRLVADGGNLAEMIGFDVGAAQLPPLEEDGEGACLVSQLVGELDDPAPGDVELYNPFGEAAHLLNASVPISLHHWLVTRRPDPGSGCRLLSTTGERWATCDLELAELPNLAPLHAPDAERGLGGPELVPVAPRGLSVQVRELAGNTLSWGANLWFLGLRIGGPEDLDDRIRGQLNTETAAVLRRHLRATDRLFNVEGQPVYALFLRGFDGEDAAHLADRLATVLRRLDLAGELPVSVDSVTEELTGEAGLERFVDQVTGWLSP
jgi:3-oxoacyl-[acyl-carrier-protein] synthase III